MAYPCLSSSFKFPKLPFQDLETPELIRIQRLQRKAKWNLIAQMGDVILCTAVRVKFVVFLNTTLNFFLIFLALKHEPTFLIWCIWWFYVLQTDPTVSLFFFFYHWENDRLIWGESEVTPMFQFSNVHLCSTSYWLRKRKAAGNDQVDETLISFLDGMGTGLIPDFRDPSSEGLEGTIFSASERSSVCHVQGKCLPCCPIFTVPDLLNTKPYKSWQSLH